ncbi:MAG: hypothetical protein ISP49_09215 [Reyranella sp.]|nr:hypothetical protein [Reyranella sp.]MBL6651759.1 hypothetical protein [Reyranella sp.]
MTAMPNVFAVTRTRGANWNSDLAMDQQDDWREHADFMNGLHKDRVVMLGGPLEGTSEILLVIRAATEDEVRRRLSGDCWSRTDILRIGRIVPWRLRLGSLD